MQCWRVITLPLLNCWVCTTLNSAGFVRASLRERGLDPQTPFVVSHAARNGLLRRELANHDVILRF